MENSLHRQAGSNNSSPVECKVLYFQISISGEIAAYVSSHRGQRKKEDRAYYCPVVLTTVMLKAYSRSKGRAATKSTKNQVVA